MPLPYHGIDRDSTLDADERAFRKLLNMEIACLNFLHLGSRCDPPASICGPHELSGRQWEVVQRFRHLGALWAEHPQVNAEDLGRTASKQERQQEILESSPCFAARSFLACKSTAETLAV